MIYDFNFMKIRKLERKKGITGNKTRYYLGALKKDNDGQQIPMLYISSIYENTAGNKYFEYKGIYYKLNDNGTTELLK